MNEFIISFGILIIIVIVSLRYKRKNDEVLVNSLEEAYRSTENIKGWFTAAELRLELYELACDLKQKLWFTDHIERVRSLQEKVRISVEEYKNDKN